MHRKLLPILLALIISSSSYAYISAISIWKNDQGVVIYVGADIHNLGTKQDNLDQLKLFEDHFFSYFKRGSKKLKILFENGFLRHLNLNGSSEFEMAQTGEVDIPIRLDTCGRTKYKKNFSSLHTWIGFEA